MRELKIYAADVEVGGVAKEIATNFDMTLAVIEQLQGGFAARAPLELVKDIVKALSADTPYISYIVPEGFQLFRGRIENSIKTFLDVKEFSYRPLEKSTSFGRCHRPGSTVLYGTTKQNTVFSELKPEIGDKVHIGIASVVPDNLPRVTAIGEIDYSRRYDRPFIGNQHTYYFQNNMLNQLREHNENTHLRVLVADAFFADVFSKSAIRERDYKITSCLAEHLLNFKITVDDIDLLQDGFAYPSVEHRGGVNFAIAPNAFDRKFRWVKFIAGEIVNYLGFGLYSYQPYAESESIEDGGAIHWKSVA